jgi:transcriptional regulator with XRE-family HTH domain
MVTTAGPPPGPAQAIAASANGSPTVLRMLLGAYLRRLREAKRISLQDAGEVVRASHSKMSRIETGRVGFKDRDIADLLTFYEVNDEVERQALRALAVQANSAAWWHDYADVLPGWFDDYVGLEEAADEISGYEVQFVPGLLQTEDYARAVIMLGYSHPKEISRRVKLRMTRQAVLARPNGPALRLIIDEAALQRPIGGPTVMRGQIRHLIEVSQHPKVTIQVVPFQVGGHAGAGGPFSLLRFADADLPDIVYLEQLACAIYHDKPGIVKGYLAVMDRLRNEALNPADSIRTLKSMLGDVGA